MDKSRTMTASVGRTTEREHFVKHQNTMVAEPIRVGTMPNAEGKITGTQRPRVYSIDGKAIICDPDNHGKYAEPVRVGSLPREDGELTDSKQYRIYSVDGKATTQCGQGGGMGAKTGLYAVELSEREMDYMVRDHQDQRWSFLNRPAEDDKSKCVVANYSKGVPYNVLAEPINVTDDGKSQTIKAQYDRTSVANICAYSSTYGATGIAEPTDEEQDEQYAGDGKDQNAMRRVYEVKDGLITIKGKQYPIKLADGCYRIRKLTVKECCRLQTMPDDYCRAVSNSQAYKGLWNGWTAEVIIHILNEALKDVPKDEEIVVLSMYDGIGTGRYCLDKMGFTNVKYYAYEIDKYAMQIAKSNYPDIIECGDAFQLRNDDWSIGYGSFT